MNGPDRPLYGRSALITGASQGLGFAIACAYVKAGASVLLCARDAVMLERARGEVAALASSHQLVLARPADVTLREDVEQLAQMALCQLPGLQILVNNAGVYGPIGPIEDVDWDVWLQAIEINLFGSILLCRALVPHLKASHYGKIIQLSGGGATNPLPRFSAYAASKAAVVRFAETLAEEVRGDNIDVNCIAPGALNTRLLDEVLTAGPGRAGRMFHERSLKQKQEGGTPLSKGADLAVFLGSPASDGITGKLLSAVWDPWETLPEHRTELSASDVYTLRRIVPDDRGFKWGDR
jgi:NAD(P)-dependent dehydrogenase (short-subunit alcohol dehydrogenase family)